MELKSGYLFFQKYQRGDWKGEDEMEKKQRRRKREKKSMLNCSIVKNVMVKKFRNTANCVKSV